LATIDREVSIAVVVPGHGVLAGDGSYRITRRCLRLVAEAEKLAEDLSPVAVVFSGWSPVGGRSEAEQMKDAWRGPEVELVVEPTARFTAENASRTLPLILERGVEEAVIVCALPHFVRTRLFFHRLYRERGVTTRFQVLRSASPHAVVREIVALPLCPWQLRAARAELNRETL